MGDPFKAYGKLATNKQELKDCPTDAPHWNVVGRGPEDAREVPLTNWWLVNGTALLS